MRYDLCLAIDEHDDDYGGDYDDDDGDDDDGDDDGDDDDDDDDDDVHRYVIVRKHTSGRRLLGTHSPFMTELSAVFFGGSLAWTYQHCQK